MSPLEDRHILVQIPLADAPERPQEVPQACPQPLQRVALDLAHPVAIGVDRPGALGPRLIDGLVDAALPSVHPVVAVPLIDVDSRPLQSALVDDRLLLAGAGRFDHVPADLVRLPPDHGIAQGIAVQPQSGVLLESVPQGQQMPAIAS
jgi:hypothetical protein